MKVLLLKPHKNKTSGREIPSGKILEVLPSYGRELIKAGICEEIFDLPQRNIVEGELISNDDEEEKGRSFDEED